MSLARSEAANIVISYHRHLVITRQNVGAKTKCLLCFKSSASGLLSDIVIFMTWQTPLSKSPKSERSCQSGRQHCTPVYMYNSMYRCGGNSYTCYLLTQHWVNPRGLAAEC